MTEVKSIEEQTVKALSWQMLYGNYRPKLGAEGWQKLTDTVGAPDFRKMDQDEDCPMGPFNQAVLYIDNELGKGDGALIEEITIASVERWASIFRNLVKQLQGRPQKMMEIFCTEVHPYFLNDPTVSDIVESDSDHFILRLDNGLLEGFKVGLIRGFCDIVSADAEIEKRGDEYHVTWKLREERPDPSRWALFVNATRLPFLTATVVPVLLGTAVAWNDGSFDFPLFLLTLLGAASFHIATNVINDYFDHTSGVDESNLTPTPFSGGSRLIQRGLFTPNQTRNLALVFYLIGIVIGFILVGMRGLEIIYFGLAGSVLGLLYTAPQTQVWSWEAMLAALPVGLLIAAVLYINQFPDKLWDGQAGKGTLVVRLPTNIAIFSYAALVGGAYLVIVLGVLLNQFPIATLLGLLTIPMAWSAYKKLRRHHAYPYRLIPANASTIFTHLLTGLLMFAGYVIS
jgi:1,4-dihydroxy-2-naphthoate octaprenyltransferase